MKTRYLAEAELALIRGDTSNKYLLDVLGLPYQVGLLSALPTNFSQGAGDNWSGARELFYTTTYTYPDTLEQLVGINHNNVGPTTSHKYTSVAFNKANIGNPSLVYNAGLTASGMGIQFNQEIIFPDAAENWGVVRGVVIYAIRNSGGIRITPIMVGELVSPVTVLAGQIFKIPNTSTSKIRYIEFTRKTTLS